MPPESPVSEEELNELLEQFKEANSIYTKNSFQ